jgi:hypothetical protein
VSEISLTFLLSYFASHKPGSFSPFLFVGTEILAELINYCNLQNRSASRRLFCHLASPLNQKYETANGSGSHGILPDGLR